MSESQPPINAKQGLLFEYVQSYSPIVCPGLTDNIGGGASFGFYFPPRAVDKAQMMRCYIYRLSVSVNRKQLCANYLLKCSIRHNIKPPAKLKREFKVKPRRTEWPP